MLVQKRDGKTQEFDNKKIYCAIESAALDVMPFIDTKTEGIIKRIVKEIKSEFKKDPDNTPTVEEIQDKVEEKLMGSHLKDVARAYIRYRYKKEVLRKSNTTDQSIFELLSGTSDYWNNENANKNPKTVTTQRDYIAGITSTDITKRFLLDKDIVKAHEEGIIHFHDADYFAQAALHNCELLNLEDILQNGTVINGVMIEKPHRLLTAATIATQVILAVTSSSYGGCTVSLTHLAPFVRSSYEYYVNKYKEAGLKEEDVLKLADSAIRKEVVDAVQTFNYQVNSMTNTNG